MLSNNIIIDPAFNKRRYKVIDNIGHGAYGAVCSAVDTLTEEKVAIKKISNIYNQPKFAMRTLREVKILRHLKHDNIISVRNIFMSTDDPVCASDIYIVMDLMESDLHRVIYSKQELTDEHCCFFAYQLLRGLKYIHSANIIHRDLKPGNILINENCHLRIADFGMSRGTNDTCVQGVHMTQYVATRWYRAPELLLDHNYYTTSVDMWSVGCILAEIKNRKVLFPGKSTVNQLDLIVASLGLPDVTKHQRLHAGIVRMLKSQEIRSPAKLVDCFQSDSQLFDLISRLLVLASEDRLLVNECLEHAYVSKYHDEEDETTCQLPFDFQFEDEFKNSDINGLCRLFETEFKNYRIFGELKPLHMSHFQNQIQKNEPENNQTNNTPNSNNSFETKTSNANLESDINKSLKNSDINVVSNLSTFSSLEGKSFTVQKKESPNLFPFKKRDFAAHIKETSAVNDTTKPEIQDMNNKTSSVPNVHVDSIKKKLAERIMLKDKDKCVVKKRTAAFVHQERLELKRKKMEKNKNKVKKISQTKLSETDVKILEKWNCMQKNNRPQNTAKLKQSTSYKYDSLINKPEVVSTNMSKDGLESIMPVSFLPTSFSLLNSTVFGLPLNSKDFNNVDPSNKTLQKDSFLSNDTSLYTSKLEMNVHIHNYIQENSIIREKYVQNNLNVDFLTAIMQLKSNETSNKSLCMDSGALSATLVQDWQSMVNQINSPEFTACMDAFNNSQINIQEICSGLKSGTIKLPSEVTNSKDA